MTIIQSLMVKPSHKTPQKILQLSKLDMIIRSPTTHTNVFYIYDRPPPSKSPLPYFDAEILKNALSKMLVPYYPLAGRLQLNQNKDRYEINCNAKGVVFVEAKTNLTIKDLNGFKPCAALRELMIPECDYSRGFDTIPLLMVQVTWFKCGGLGLGFSTHHHIGDGSANVDFVAKLLRSVSGSSDLVVSPVYDRIHVAPRDPLCVKFRHLHEFDPMVPSLPANGFISGDKINDTTQCVFKLSKQQIQALKQATLSQAMNYTNNNDKHKLSTYVILAAHIWQSVCNARDVPRDREVKLYIPVDGRSRLKNPVIPKGYFGNVLFFAICIAKAGDVIHLPIWHTARKIQESIDKMDDEYLRSSIDHLELRQGLPEPSMGAHKFTYPDLAINSWVKLPYYKADFGWGPPKDVRNCEIKLEGLSFLMDSPDGDEGLNLAINLFSVHMPLFKKYLYNSMPIYSSL